jgi:hypothetical protein
MGKQIDGVRMRQLAEMIKKEIPGLGFALITFEFIETTAPANYISNAQREDMIKAIEEILDRWKKGKTFPTPEAN